ncbi:MAG: hypothetical protein MUF12_08475 [Sediminibacterium sp.]|jgi:hypothetical protein|nr:hypothetical protein [Sediminibacterium sp.]
MTKEQIIEKLEATRKMMNTLTDDCFNYSVFKTKCGTQHCVAGNYPVWFPEAGFSFNDKGNFCFYENACTKEVEAGMQIYHGMKQKLIDHLFYSISIFTEHELYGEIALTNDERYSLEQVKTVFDKVLNLLKTTSILDKYLIID